VYIVYWDHITLNNFSVAIAQFERSIMLDRQRVGIAKAKADGKLTGRKPTARANAD
jgi:DNA invertase Pin-like site-specific DNA recombinase